MAVVINLVSRYEDRAFRRANADLAVFAKKAVASQNSLAGSAIRTGAALKRQGASMQAFGGGLTRWVTLPLAGIGALSVKALKDFDEEMTESTAIMSGVTKKVRADMEKTAKSVAVSSTFGASQAAEAYFFLASAGLDAQRSMAALPGVARFAQAGAFDLKSATDLLTDAQSALGMASKNASTYMHQQARVADVLVRANTLANASVEQFSEALTNKAAASLRQVNKSVEEGTAVLAVFADQGLKGKAAGQALFMVLRDLQKANSTQPEAWKKLGLSVYDSAGKMRNTADIIADMEKSFEGLSDKQKRARITSLGFTDKALAPLLMLMGKSEGISTYERKLRKATGFTASVAKKQLRSFSAQFTLLKNRLTNVGISVGKVLMPRLMKFAGWMGKAVKWFEKLNPQTQDMAIKLGLVAAAAGPVILIMGKMTGVVGSLLMTAGTFGATFAGAMAKGASGAMAFGMAMNASGLLAFGIVAIIAAVIVGLVLLYTKCAWFRKVVNAVFKAVASVFKVFYKVVSAVIGWIVDHWRGLVDAFLLASGPIGWIVMYVIHHFDTVKKKVGAVLSWLWDKWKWVWDKVMKYTPVGLIVKAFKWLVGKVTENWTKILQTIGSVVNKIGGFINTAFGWTGIHVPTVSWGVSGVAGNQSGAGGQHFARGGVVPGRKTEGDNVPILATAGERVLSLKEVAALGGNRAVTALLEAAGARHFARGGVVGAVSGIFDKVWQGAKSIAGAVTGVLDKLDLGNLADRLAGPFGKLIPAIMARVTKKLTEKVTSWFGSGDGLRAAIVKNATSQVGKPYVWGGTGPGGFDCSGLMYYAYQKAGVKNFPRIPTYGGRQIPKNMAQPADVMFYYPGAIQGGARVPFGHFKMYMGGGKTVESASGGVQIRAADWSGAAQVRSYLGATSKGRGGVRTYDSGGYLPTGLSMAYNGTGRPEPVGPAAERIVFQDCTFYGAPPEAWLESAYQHGKKRTTQDRRVRGRTLGLASP